MAVPAIRSSSRAGIPCRPARAHLTLEEFHAIIDAVLEAVPVHCCFQEQDRGVRPGHILVLNCVRISTLEMRLVQHLWQMDAHEHAGHSLDASQVSSMPYLGSRVHAKLPHDFACAAGIEGDASMPPWLEVASVRKLLSVRSESNISARNQSQGKLAAFQDFEAFATASPSWALFFCSAMSLTGNAGCGHLYREAGSQDEGFSTASRCAQDVSWELPPAVFVQN